MGSMCAIGITLGCEMTGCEKSWVGDDLVGNDLVCIVQV